MAAGLNLQELQIASPALLQTHGIINQICVEMACCAGEGSCCPGGCFAHAYVLCFGLGFAKSEDVCECTIPCFAYVSAPGIMASQILCCASSQTWSPAKPIHTNVLCLCDLCLCGCNFGNYKVESQSVASTMETVTMPPAPMKISQPSTAVAA